MQEPPVLGQVGAGVQATQEVATHILCICPGKWGLP